MNSRLRMKHAKHQRLNPSAANAPTIVSLTRRLVRTSTRRTVSSSSAVVMLFRLTLHSGLRRNDRLYSWLLHFWFKSISPPVPFRSDFLFRVTEELIERLLRFLLTLSRRQRQPLASFNSIRL